MTQLEKAQAFLSELSVEEKLQLLNYLLQSFNLTSTGITHTPGVCGGRACIRNTRIPVWTIVGAKSQGASDLEILQNFSGLNAEDITNAMRYYSGHQSEIERDLAEQEED
jgi:uncharacterized protein (DUF433 family)